MGGLIRFRVRSPWSALGRCQMSHIRQECITKLAPSLTLIPFAPLGRCFPHGYVSIAALFTP